MEFHTLAQMEHIRDRVGILPFFRKIRNRIHLIIMSNQAIK